jgi:hypothetical protein
MKLTTMLSMLFAAAVAGSAFAQTTPPAGNTNTPVIDKRLDNQEKRIGQGVSSGQLTPKEAARMERKEAKIRAAEDKAKSDGTVTKKERAKLTKMENKQSKRIYRQKHDAQTVTPGASPAK